MLSLFLMSVLSSATAWSGYPIAGFSGSSAPAGLTASGPNSLGDTSQGGTGGV